MKKNGTEKIVIDGILFEIGYLSESEFSGYVCAMKKNNEWHGVLFVDNNNREIGFNSGIMATDNEIQAIGKAKKMMKEVYGSNRYHG